MGSYWYQFNNGDLLRSEVLPSEVDCQPAPGTQGQLVYQVFSSRERFRLLRLHRRQQTGGMEWDQAA